MKIIFANIKYQKFRYTMIFMIIFTMTLCIFSSNMLITSMTQGIATAKNRLGADITIIPKGDDSVTEETLFDGQPSTLKMDSDWLGKIKKMPYITDITSRLYIASLSGQSCCDSSVQLIATNIAEDFLLKSWITDDISELASKEIIVGSSFNAKIGDTLKYYNIDFTVKGVLEKTNTGYDKSAFISYEAADEIMQNPKYNQYFKRNENGYNTISMIFINSSNPEATRDVIRSKYYYDDIEIYSTNAKLSDYTMSVDSSKIFTYALNILILIISALSLITINTLATSNRKNEVGSMLNVGFSKFYIAMIFMFESLLISIMASLSAVITFEILFTLFNTWIGEIFVSPMINPSINDIMATTKLLLILSTLLTVMSMVIAFAHIYKKSPSELIKEAS